MAGSKDVNELHSSGLVNFVDTGGEEGMGDTGDREGEAVNSGDCDANDVDTGVFSEALPPSLGTAKVNDDCLSDRFSC